jgi:hypothetical protein
MGYDKNSEKYERQRDYLLWKVSDYRRRMKIKAVEYKGGKCQICGYDKSPAAMDFHHTDPKLKDFQISSGRSIGWEKMKSELNKTILLCANCHRETHWNESEKILEEREIKVRSKHKKQSDRSVLVRCSFCKKGFKISLSRRYKVKNPFCSHTCSEKFNEKIKWPTSEELKKLVWKYPLTKLSKEFGVSDKSIIKRCRKFNIETPGVGHWNKVYAMPL